MPPIISGNALSRQPCLADKSRNEPEPAKVKYSISKGISTSARERYETLAPRAYTKTGMNASNGPPVFLFFSFGPVRHFRGGWGAAFPHVSPAIPANFFFDPWSPGLETAGSGAYSGRPGLPKRTPATPHGGTLSTTLLPSITVRLSSRWANLPWTSSVRGTRSLAADSAGTAKLRRDNSRVRSPAVFRLTTVT